MARLLGMIHTSFLVGNRVDARHLIMIGNALGSLHRRQAWKTAQVAHRNDPLLNVIDIVSDEAASPFIEDQPESTARVEGRGKVATLGIKAEVEAADIDRSGTRASGYDFATVPTVHSVHTVIEAPAQTVHVAIGDPKDETFQDDLSHIGFSVPVGILQENNFWRGGHENATVPGSNRSRKTESLREQSAAVDLAVVVGVFEQTNGSSRFAIWPEPVRIITHLDHVHSAFF